jgi:hypothetical protein
MYCVDFEAGNKNYRLRIDIMSLMALEKQIGCNPLAIFGEGDKLPTITAMIHILHASLQPMQHGITVNDAAKIFEKWLSEDHTPLDFLPIIIDIYKASGIIKPDTDEKNV